MSEKINNSNRLDLDSTYNYIVIGILCLGLSIRLMGLNKGIWLDEYASLDVIFQDGFFQTLRTLNNPPLYFVLLKLWSQISTSGQFLRLLSVVFGIATVLVIMKWIKEYSYLASILAGLYCATMPIMLRYSQEIRNYPLLLFVTSLAFFFASRLIAKPGEPSGYVGLAFSLTIAIATHLVGVMLIASVCLFIAVTLSDYNRVRLGNFILTLAVPSSVFILLYFFFMQQVHDKSNWWMPPVSLELVLSTAKYVLGVSSVFWPLLIIQDKIPSLAIPFDRLVKSLILGLVGSLVFFGNWRRSLPLLVAAILYWLQLLIYSFLVTPIFWYRTVLPGIVPLIGFIGLQIATIRVKKVKIASIVGLILLSLSFTANWIVNEAWTPYEQWKQISQSLESNWEQNNFVIFYPAYTEGPTRYYSSDLPSEAIIAVKIGANTEELESEIHKQIVSLEEREISPVVFLIVRSDLSVEKDLETYRRLLAYLESRFGQPSLSQNFGLLSLSKYELKESN